MSDTPFTEGHTLRFEQRPRAEGCNVGTWIGFKHVLYMAEEAALQYLRQVGFGMGPLLKDFALCVELVDSRLRLSRPIEIDDVVQIEVRNVTGRQARELTLAVTMAIAGSAAPRIASGHVKLQLRKASGDLGNGVAPPEALAQFVTERIQRDPSRQAMPATLELHRDSKTGERVPLALPKTFTWKSTIPYYYCHFTERMRHSGYVRHMEESVARFLADRGISIATFLRERHWIPVVLAADVEVLAEAQMEETLWTAFTVTEILKNTTYTARVDYYVERDERLVPTATGTITHAYLEILDRGVGSTVVPFDARVLAALESEGVRK